jgi:acetamidase/formamidase
VLPVSERADRVVIHASGKALHGDFSADREPVVTIAPGDAVRLSTLGSTLFLPIGVAGGLLSVGDGHGVQGDGEVAGTAIECPMDRVDLTIRLRDDFPIDGPVARTPAGWIALGLGDTLDDAAFSAMEGMIALLGRLRGWDRPSRSRCAAWPRTCGSPRWSTRWWACTRLWRRVRSGRNADRL